MSPRLSGKVTTIALVIFKVTGTRVDGTPLDSFKKLHHHNVEVPERGVAINAPVDASKPLVSADVVYQTELLVVTGVLPRYVSLKVSYMIKPTGVYVADVSVTVVAALVAGVSRELHPLVTTQ